VSPGRWLRRGVTSDSTIGTPTVDRVNTMQPAGGAARATLFIAIDGESFNDDSLERDRYEDDGGES
jgi:hypothetical protein